MQLLKAAVSVIVGVLAGVVLGYALWGQQATETAIVTGELEQTRAWLRDEIRWSDERYDHVSAALTQAQTDLAQARGELARTRANLEQTIGNPKAERLHVKELNEAARPTSTR